MARVKIPLELEISTDGVPGWGYDPTDFVTLIREELERQVGHYKPVLTVTGEIVKYPNSPILKVKDD